MLIHAHMRVYVAAWLGISAGVSFALAAQTPTASMSSATPLMTAAFVVPHTLVDLQSSHLLRACQSTFERTMRLALASATNTPSATEDDQPPRDSVFSPIPPAATTAGRACLSRIGDTRMLARFDLPLLLRLAIGVNDDTLVHQVVMRQLALAGQSMRERGHALETAIDELLHNRWNNSARVHRTTAHDALARQYAVMLDTMQPVEQVLLSRLHVMEKLAEAQVPAEWDVDEQLAQQRAHLQVATSVPLSAVPPDDTAEVHASRSPIAVAWTTYLKTPTHANLARWIAVRDSMLHVQPGQTIDSLLNHTAPQLTADYWFNLPTGTTAPVVPTPGMVSLILFGNDLDSTRVAKLRTLHATYPTLQIVLVAMTHREFNEVNGQPLSNQPAREAERIHHHLTDELRLPGIVCVLRTQYHTEPKLKRIPVASPVLDRFHLDPRAYAGHIFLVDAEGVLVSDRPESVWNGRLIQRLLHH
jgi:hypothetical protein